MPQLDLFETQFVTNAERKTIIRPKYENLDLAVYTWVKSQRAQGLEIDRLMLKIKALEFNTLLGGSEDFAASTGWISRFLERHQIRNVGVQGERQNADHEAALSFLSTMQKIIDDEGVTEGQIYNADESGLVWKKTLRKTLVLPNEIDPPGRKIIKIG